MRDEDLEEVYNGVRIAFFLQWLESPHLVRPFDWFVAEGRALPHPALRRDAGLYQVALYERLPETLEDYLRRERPGLGAVRALLFQLLHTLELAWHALHFVHYDIHTTNIMLSGEGHPAFTYTRDQRVYHAALPGGRLAKLIDFGRSRLDVRSLGALGPPEGYVESAGYGPALEANPCYDVRLLFFCLFVFGGGDDEARAEWWRQLRAENAWQAALLEDLTERALELGEVARRMRAAWDEADQRAHGLLPGYPLTLALARQMEAQHRRVFNTTEFIRSPDAFGYTPGQALDHAFFTPLLVSDQ